MITRKFRKYFRRFRRWLRKRKLAVTVTIMLLLFGGFLYTTNIENERIAVDPATYTPLLNLIADAESNGNYNAYFGNAGNTSIDFTNMTIAEVMKWQADFVAQGHASSAVGRYQIIDSTLAGLVRQLGIDKHERFDQPMQDKLAIALLERRGAVAYASKRQTPEEFAASIAKEWAGLPKVLGDHPEQSYYASDGLNRSQVTVARVLHAISSISTE